MTTVTSPAGWLYYIPSSLTNGTNGAKNSATATDTPAASSDPSSTPPSDRTQKALTAIDEIEAIPDQIKKRAHDWAKGELKNLLTVLRVTLLNTPDHTHALNDIAKKIASDAKDIAGTGLNASPATHSSAQNPASSLILSDTQISLSFSETETDATLDSNGDLTVTSSSFSETVNLEIITAQPNSTGAAVEATDDAGLLSEAAKAIRAIKDAVAQAAHKADRKKLQNDVNGAGNDIQNSINGLLKEATDALQGSPLSLTSIINDPSAVVA